MSHDATLQKVIAHAKQVALVKSTMGLLQWDEETYLPPAGAQHRADQLAYLAGLAHRLGTAPELGDWLAELDGDWLAALDGDAATQDPLSDAGCVVRLLKRDYDKRARLDQDLVERIAKTTSLAQQAWREARRADDFAAFRPWLEEVVALKREEGACHAPGMAPYDALLDDYEPGENAENLSRVLGALRDELTPLVGEIAASGARPRAGLLRGDFPADAQAAFGAGVARALGFDFDAGRLDVTAHPFCGGGGPRDVRLTTRYNPQWFSDGFYSILHETGHGLYEQGLPVDHYGLPTGEAVSLGIHESQSRMWENLVGRSRAFWEWLLPAFYKAFPGSERAAVDDYYFAANESGPSLIRTESDEATYNLHIVVRFELERELIGGGLRPADLPGAWNEKYSQLLGITPPSDADGCLQDVHWAAGLFGYFPTYALGNLYAAQFFAKARADLGDLDAQFRAGEFAPLLGWLRAQIHRHGRRYSATQLVQVVTGAPLGSGPLMAHLRGKFGGLYGLGGAPALASQGRASLL